MLSVMRNLWALCALLALASLSMAISIEEALHIDGIEAYLHQGVKRQASGTGNLPVSTPVATPTPSEQRPSSAPAVVSTPTPTPTPEVTPSSAAAAPGSTPVTSAANRQSSAAVVVQSSKITEPVVHSTPLVSLSVAQFTTVIFTQSNGQDIAITSVGQSTAVITTGTAVSTELPTTQEGSSSGGGMSSSKKALIGGLVGGIGGAILLGGLAVVAWRIWGRRDHVHEDDADLMAGTGSALGDKSTTSSPFQSNLEQYHNPSARPNAAANF